MEKTKLPDGPDCARCKHRGVQHFPHGIKTVCIKDPPRVFGQFVPGPDGKGAMFIFETAYPVPPLPCSQFEEQART